MQQQNRQDKDIVEVQRGSIYKENREMGYEYKDKREEDVVREFRNGNRGGQCL
jgi:hypothetical protein